eukprot:14386642-Alexandrium_andersonii.AAC.1
MPSGVGHPMVGEQYLRLLQERVAERGREVEDALQPHLARDMQEVAVGNEQHLRLGQGELERAEGGGNLVEKAAWMWMSSQSTLITPSTNSWKG